MDILVKRKISQFSRLPRFLHHFRFCFVSFCDPGQRLVCQPEPVAPHLSGVGGMGMGGRRILSRICLFVFSTGVTDIGIKHDFPFINIRKVPRKVLKTEGKAQGCQHLPRDLGSVNESQTHVWTLLLLKFKENTPKIWENVCALYSSALPPFSYACMLFIDILDSGRGQVLFLMMTWRLSMRFAWRPGQCINIIQ